MKLTAIDIRSMAQEYEKHEGQSTNVSGRAVDPQTLLNWVVSGDGQVELPYLEGAESWDHEPVMDETSLQHFLEEMLEVESVGALDTLRVLSQLGIALYKEGKGVLCFVPGNNSINITPGYVLFPMPKV